MTGIIICDKCFKCFLAHGKRDSLPKELSIIPLFNGTRFIRSETFDTTISIFIDVCGECSQ